MEQLKTWKQVQTKHLEYVTTRGKQNQIEGIENEIESRKFSVKKHFMRNPEL
jgi:hypothetical protein